MKKSLSFIVLATSLGLSQAACLTAREDDATRSPVASTVDQPLSTAPFQRLYFGLTNQVSVEGDVLAGLDLEAGSSVQLEVATTDASSLRFEIWSVHEDGNVGLVNAFDTDSGFVLTTFDSPSDARTFLHFPAPASGRDVTVFLGCERANGRCVSALQPGETCLAGRSCDEGLTCVPSDDTCSSAWQGGTCVLPSDGSECADEIVSGPVCGCDGHSYDSNCLANAAGVGVKSSGACSPVAPPK